MHKSRLGTIIWRKAKNPTTTARTAPLPPTTSTTTAEPLTPAGTATVAAATATPAAIATVAASAASAAQQQNRTAEAEEPQHKRSTYPCYKSLFNCPSTPGWTSNKSFAWQTTADLLLFEQLLSIVCFVLDQTISWNMWKQSLHDPKIIKNPSIFVFLQKDMLQLRSLSVTASLFGIAYNLLQPSPLWAPAAWGGFFISCHLWLGNSSKLAHLGSLFAFGRFDMFMMLYGFGVNWHLCWSMLSLMCDSIHSWMVYVGKIR